MPELHEYVLYGIVALGKTLLNFIFDKILSIKIKVMPE